MSFKQAYQVGSVQVYADEQATRDVALWTDEVLVENTVITTVSNKGYLAAKASILLTKILNIPTKKCWIVDPTQPDTLPDSKPGCAYFTQKIIPTYVQVDVRVDARMHIATPVTVINNEAMSQATQMFALMHIYYRTHGLYLEKTRFTFGTTEQNSELIPIACFGDPDNSWLHLLSGTSESKRRTYDNRSIKTRLLESYGWSPSSPKVPTLSPKDHEAIADTYLTPYAMLGIRC